MKIVFSFIIFSLFAMACNNTGKSKDEKNLTNTEKTGVKDEAKNKTDAVAGMERYGIRSGRVVTSTGLPNSMGTSVSTMYFDNYGNLSYTETVTKLPMKGVPAQPKQFTVRKDDYIYSWTEGKNTGTKMKLDIRDLKNIDFEKLSQEMINEMKMTKGGNENFLGKSCEVMEMNSESLGKGKILTWKKIPMLSDMTTMGMHVRAEVTELEENPVIDPAKFELPAGIDFREREIKLK